MEVYTYDIKPMDMENAGSISSTIKRILTKKNVEKFIIRRVAIASYEAEINVVIHSCGGYCDIICEENRLVLQFNDFGPGIPDLESAMKAGWSTASKLDHELGFGAGMGFTNMKNASDKLNVTTSEEGTHVEIIFNLRYNNV